MKFTISIIAAMAAGAMAFTNLKNDCNDFIVDDRLGMLYATCSHNGGPPGPFGSWNRVSAQLDLNSVLINDHGKLAWQRNGIAFFSCHSCNISGVQLTCACHDGTAHDMVTAVMLDYQIFADRGTLRYLGWEDRPPNREGS